jgi:glycosyltransferase involved in cell wall biosynthesis
MPHNFPHWTSSDVLIIIPAYNEEEVIAQTISNIPKEYDVLVINNGSDDSTAQQVRSSRAMIVEETRKGYGQAVWTGILEGIRRDYKIGVVYDADGANDPQDIEKVVNPICLQTYDLCIAQRTKYAKPGSLTPIQRYGNRLSTFLIRGITGYSYSDMGSMRAFPLQKFKRLKMNDRGYGWNIEMQIKAVRKQWRILELDLSYRVRQGGESKISGNRYAAVKAGVKIIETAIRYAK